MPNDDKYIKLRRAVETLQKIETFKTGVRVTRRIPMMVGRIS